MSVKKLSLAKNAMQILHIFWILLLIILIIGALLFQNFLFAFILNVITIISFVFILWREKKISESQMEEKLKNDNQHWTEEISRYKSVESFLQEKTKELERTKLAMTSMTKDVLVERDKAEKERAKDEAILSSVGEVMFAVGLDGNIVFINPVAQAFLGVKEEEALGKFINQFFILYDESMNAVIREKQPIVQALNSGTKVTQTFVYVDTYKQKRFLNITATPIKQQEVLIGAICIVRDITKEKEVDRMKTEFISLASHQLRTPLSAIKWFGEMLFGGDAGPLNAEQKQFMQNINQSTERMIELVNSLLNISRIESGRIIIDPKPTDLKELIDTVAIEIKLKIQEKNQKFSINIAEGIPLINIDPKLIRQVYLNLLTNAIKYSPKGAEIAVSVSKKDNYILSQISDNGYGIPAQQQNKIFEKFFRADNIVKIETEGTGLGLYLIKAIVASSGGKIWFQSQEGKGASFFFTLPESGMQAKKGEVSLD